MINQVNPHKEHITLRKKIMICLAAGADAILGTVVHAAYMKYYTDFIGLDAKLYGLMYLIFGTWNAVNDPLLGIYSDKKKYIEGKGKAVYLMKRTAPLMVFSMIAMLYASPSWNQWVIFGYLLVVMFLYDTASTLFGINYKIYLLYIATSPEERTQFSIIQKYVNMLPAFVAGLIPVWFLTGDYSMAVIKMVFIISGLIGAVLFSFTLIYLKDYPEFYKHQEFADDFDFKKNMKLIFTSRSFLTFVMFAFLITGVQRSYYTLYIYYMDNVMNVSETLALLPDVFGAVVQLAIYPLVARIVRKVGCRDTIKHFTWFSLLGFTGLVFVPSYWMVVLCYGFIMIGFAAYWAVLDPMFGTLIDENEIQSGERKAGFFMGLMAVVTIPAQSFIVFLFTMLISYFNYDGSTKIQTAESMMGIRLGVGMLPVIFLALSLIPVYLYPITRKRELEIKEQIEKIHS